MFVYIAFIFFLSYFLNNNFEGQQEPNVASVMGHPFYQKLGFGLPGLHSAKNEQQNMCTQDREERRLVMWMAQGHHFR